MRFWTIKEVFTAKMINKKVVARVATRRNVYFCWIKFTHFAVLWSNWATMCFRQFSENPLSGLKIKIGLWLRIPRSHLPSKWPQNELSSFFQSKSRTKTRFSHFLAGSIAFFALLMGGSSDWADFLYTTVFEHEESESDWICC